MNYRETKFLVVPYGRNYAMIEPFGDMLLSGNNAIENVFLQLNLQIEMQLDQLRFDFRS